MYNSSAQSLGLSLIQKKEHSLKLLCCGMWKLKESKLCVDVTTKITSVWSEASIRLMTRSTLCLGLQTAHSCLHMTSIMLQPITAGDP